jgi:hypothetical protein
LIAATGTSVAITSAEGVKNSMPPERTCASMSVSPPSWLFGKILISTRPLLSFAMRSAASCARMFSGCVTGRLLPYLYENSAARAMRGSALATPAAGRADRVRKTLRRFIDCMCVSVVLMMRFDASLSDLQ